MYCHKNKIEYRNNYSCINLSTLRSDKPGRPWWLLTLIRGMKKIYHCFPRNHTLLCHDRLVNCFVWAAGLIVFVIALLQ